MGDDRPLLGEVVVDLDGDEVWCSAHPTGGDVETCDACRAVAWMPLEHLVYHRWLAHTSPGWLGQAKYLAAVFRSIRIHPHR